MDKTLLLGALAVVLAASVAVRAEPTPPVDRLGDPLPPGALLRLGSRRLRHDEGTDAVPVFLPDGRTLLSAGRDGIRLWEVATGKLVRRLEGLPEPPSAVAVSREGRRLAVAYSPCILFWDLENSEPLGRVPLAGEKERVNALHFTPDGGAVVAGGEDRGVRRWDIGTGQLVWRAGSSGVVLCLALSPDGRTVAAGGYGETVVLLDAATGTERSPLRLAFNEHAHALAFTPDGRSLITGGTVHPPASVQAPPQGSLRLWDLVEGKERRRFAPPERNVADVVVSGHGTEVTAFGRDAAWGKRTMTVSRIADGTEVRRLVLEHEGEGPKGLVLSPDGKVVAGGGWSCGLRLWDAATGALLPRGTGHFAAVNAIAFSPDGRSVATTSLSEQVIYLWDAERGTPRRGLRGHKDFVRQVVFTPDGRALLSADRDNTMHRWDAATGRSLLYWPLSRSDKPEDRQQTLVLSLSADGRTARTRTIGFSGDAPGDITAWDAVTGRALTRRVAPDHYDRATFPPDGERVACATSRGFEIQPLREGGPVLLLASGLDKAVAEAATFSRDGQLFAGVFRTNERRPNGDQAFLHTLILWEVATAGEAWRTPLAESAHHLAFAPDGRLLATSERSHVVLRATATGREVQRHEGTARVGALAFTPDGRRLATGHDDSTLLFWDLTPSLKALEGPARAAPSSFWDALAGDHAGRALQAVAALASTPEETVALLERRLEPARDIEAGRLTRLLADLDGPDFDTREQAQQTLTRLGPLVASALRRTLAAEPSAEQRRRIETILRAPPLVRETESLRRLRAVRVLERIGSPAAQRLLRRLADGVATAPETKEATEAQRRLKEEGRPGG